MQLGNINISLSNIWRSHSAAPEQRIEAAPAAAEQRSIGVDNPGLTQYFGYSYSPGSATVTDTTIMGISPVWAAIGYIADALASMNSGVLKRIKDGVVPAEGHPVYELFTGRVHPYYTKFDFLRALIASACLGDGFARIHWDYSTMRPRAIEFLPRDIVQQVIALDGSMWYHVQGTVNTVQGARMISVYLPDTDIIHVKGFTFNGVKGEDIRLIHRQNFSSALHSQEYADSFFGNKAHLGGVLKSPTGLSDALYDRYSNKILPQFEGAKNAGKTIVLDNGMEYQPVQLSPNEASLVDFRNLTATDVSRIFKVPLHMLSQLDRSTFSNIEQQSGDFITHCLTPWAAKLEQEFSTKLFSTAEIKSGRVFYNFEVESMVRGDTQAIATLAAALIQHGLATPNEVRKKYFNLNPLSGGDRLFIQVNMTPMDTIDELQAPATEPTQAPANPNTDNANTDNAPTNEPAAAA